MLNVSKYTSPMDSMGFVGIKILENPINVNKQMGEAERDSTSTSTSFGSIRLEYLPTWRMSPTGCKW